MSPIEILYDPEFGEWSRRTDDHLLGVSAGPSDPADPGMASLVGVDAPESSWTVFVCMAEFIRGGPLEDEMRSSVDRALRDVPGVVSVWEEDRELWALNGDPDGADLVRAVSEAVDHLGPRARAHLDSPVQEARGSLGWFTPRLRLPWRRH
jgi:hypothetical protein